MLFFPFLQIPMWNKSFPPHSRSAWPAPHLLPAPRLGWVAGGWTDDFLRRWVFFLLFQVVQPICNWQEWAYTFLLTKHPANIWTATKRINNCVPFHDGHIFKWLCNSSKELGATCITQHQHQHYTFSAPILKRPERSFTNRNLFDHRRPHPGPLHSVQSDRKNLFALNLIHIKLVAETNVSGWSPTSSWPSVNTTIILKTTFQTLQITPMAVQQDSYRWECFAFIL